jgi:hypothetical protein
LRRLRFSSNLGSAWLSVIFCLDVNGWSALRSDSSATCCSAVRFGLSFRFYLQPVDADVSKPFWPLEQPSLVDALGGWLTRSTPPGGLRHRGCCRCCRLARKRLSKALKYVADSIDLARQLVANRRNLIGQLLSISMVGGERLLDRLELFSYFLLGSLQTLDCLRRPAWVCDLRRGRWQGIRLQQRHCAAPDDNPQEEQRGGKPSARRRSTVESSLAGHGMESRVRPKRSQRTRMLYQTVIIAVLCIRNRRKPSSLHVRICQPDGLIQRPHGSAVSRAAIASR